MAKFPYMPWWIADYFADTSDLSCEQHGVYLLLLAIAWQSPHGPALPDDMAWIKRAMQAKCSDMHGNRFNRIVPPILHRFFRQLPDKSWQQFRQFSLWEKSRKNSTTNMENARKRWLQTNNTKDLANAMAMRPHESRIPILESEKITTSLPLSRPKIEPSPTLLANVQARGWTPATQRLESLDAAIAQTKPAKPNGKHTTNPDDEPVPF